MRLISLGAGWLLGVIAGSLFPGSVWAGILLVPAAVTAVVARRHWRVLLAALLVAGTAAGALRGGLARPGPDPVEPFLGQKAVVTGVVDSAPEALGLYVRFDLKVDTVTVAGSQPVAARARMEVTTQLPEGLAVRRGLVSGFQPGDRLSLSGRIEAPRPLADFDLPGYLALQNIHAVMSFPQATLVAEGEASKVSQAIFQARSRFASVLGRTLPEPEAGFAQALTVGMRQGMPPDVTEDFRRSGGAWLLAIAGLHLSVVLGLALLPLRASLLRQRLLVYGLPLTLVWVYVLLAGSPLAAQRAAIMATFYLAARFFGRRGNGLEALLLAAIVITAVDPRALWQASFQLSFLAMAAVLLVGFPLTQRIPAWRGPLGLAGRLLASAAVMSLAAILGTLPAVALHFQRVSLLALPTSLLTLPALAPAIGGSFLTGIAALISPMTGELIGMAAWLPLKWTIWCVHLLGAPSFASMPLQMSGRLVVGVYAVAGVLLWALRARFGRRLTRGSGGAPFRFWDEARPAPVFALCVGVLAVTTAGVWAAVPAGLPAKSTSHLELRLLDVGAGQAILVTAPTGQRGLIVGGVDPRRLRQALDAALGYRGRRLDFVIASSGFDPGGLSFALKRYSVGGVLYPGLPSGPDSAYALWQQQSRDRGIPFEPAREGGVIRFGGTEIAVLAPPSPPFSSTSDDVGSNAVVLRVSFDEVSFLIASGSTDLEQTYLVEHQASLGSLVLILEGSASRASDAFLAAVIPALTVVLIGKTNAAATTPAEAIQPTDKVVAFGGAGSLALTTDGRRLWLTPSG